MTTEENEGRITTMTKSEQKRARDEERVRDRLRRVIAANELRNPGVLVMENHRPNAPPGHVEVQRDDERRTFDTDEDAARFISPTDAVSVAGDWYVPIVDAITKLGRAGTFGTDAVLLMELRDVSRLRRNHRVRAQVAQLDYDLAVKLCGVGSKTATHHKLALLIAQERSRGSRTKARRAELAWLESRDESCSYDANCSCGRVLWRNPSGPLPVPESALLEPTDTANPVSCIGDGSTGAGCGFVGGLSGGVCACGGMLLSQSALRAADEMDARWREMEAGRRDEVEVVEALSAEGHVETHFLSTRGLR